jgi:hypothetical protein
MEAATETSLIIEQITDILSRLPEEKVKETADFVSFLAQKDQKYRAFVERILEIEKEPIITCTSVEEVIKATLDADGD